MNAIGINPSLTFTATDLQQSGKGFKLGQLGETYDGKIYVFVLASAAVAQYDVVQISAAFGATGITTTNGARGLRVGVAPSAIASGSYGWVQVYGACTMNVKASCAATVRINTTATAGSPDDDATTGAKEVLGAVLTTARGGTDGSAAGLLTNPTVGATL